MYIPETYAQFYAELPSPILGQCEQPAAFQFQATLLPSGCLCPTRAPAAQQARHHSIISPESSCGPLKVDAVEPCPEPCSALPLVAMALVLLCCGFWAACWAASRALRTSGFSSPASYRIASISCFVCKQKGRHCQNSRLWSKQLAESYAASDRSNQRSEGTQQNASAAYAYITPLNCAGDNYIIHLSPSACEGMKETRSGG